jgi:hypothetical protein
VICLGVDFFEVLLFGEPGFFLLNLGDFRHFFFEYFFSPSLSYSLSEAPMM